MRHHAHLRLRTLRRTLLGGCCVGVAVGCTQEQADEVGRALGWIFLVLFLVAVVLAAMTIAALALLVVGVRRILAARRAGVAAGTRAWVYAIVGGGLLLPVVSALLPPRTGIVVLGAGAAIWSARTFGPGLPGRHGALAAGSVAGVLVVGVLAAVSHADGGGDRSQPDRFGITAEEPGCPPGVAEDRCDALVEAARRHLIEPARFGELVGAIELEVLGDGALRATTRVVADFSSPADDYIKVFETAGWQWTNKPPCPAHLEPTSSFCHDPFFFDWPDTPYRLDFTGPEGHSAQLSFIPGPSSAPTVIDGLLCDSCPPSASAPPPIRRPGS